MSVTIRDYTPEDRTGLLALVHELQGEEARYHDRMKPPHAIGDWYIDDLEEACLQAAGKIVVATDGAALVGYAAVLLHVSSRSEPDEIDYHFACVQDLAVTRQYRRRGIGGSLLRHCECLARDAGAKWLRVSVLARNGQAVRTYEKAGFRGLYATMEKPIDP